MKKYQSNVVDEDFDEEVEFDYIRRSSRENRLKNKWRDKKKINENEEDNFEVEDDFQY